MDRLASVTVYTPRLRLVGRTNFTPPRYAWYVRVETACPVRARRNHAGPRQDCARYRAAVTVRRSMANRGTDESQDSGRKHDRPDIPGDRDRRHVTRRHRAGGAQCAAPRWPDAAAPRLVPGDRDPWPDRE